MKKSRRQFIRHTTYGLAGLGVMMGMPLELIAGMRRYTSPNDRIQVGVIGCKGMGFANVRSMLKLSEVEIVALCDVDRSVLEMRSAEMEEAGLKKPKWYNDYRQLLESKDIDVVIIGTPDHWHCLQLCDAILAGKDVYCEKPIANSIEESQLMLDMVEANDRMVQIGQWQRSQPHFVDAINFVHSGKLGEIRLAKAWAYQGWMMPVDRKPDGPVPEGVDYKMWLGPAPTSFGITQVV